MFGAIYVGLSGLNAYSRGLQQVSNNVANLNSTGFKGAAVTFNDLYQLQGRPGLSYAGGSASSGNGVSIGEPQKDMRQGELRQTERDLDLAVDGSGFLVLQRGGETFYTRTGSFEVDKDGFIVLAGTDYRLATLDASGRLVSLSIDSSRINAPKQTTAVKFADNLSSTAAGHAISDVRTYGATGEAHVWKLQFAKDTSGEPGNWTVTVTNAAGKTIGSHALKFNAGIVDPSTAKLTFTDADASLAVEFDFSGTTSFSSGEVSTLRTVSVNGHGTGTVSSIKINEKGRLEISYSNEQKTDLGAVAIADFRDPQSLQQRGGGLFADPGAGDAQLTNSEDPRSGRVVSRRLEASNVDLAKQFGELILIQRGFQASSQIISVSNDMIQQLFGIRGQG
jgi:flagellar hook protein FlgE